jgi:SAM-dependent methyltransferase
VVGIPRPVDPAEDDSRRGAGEGRLVARIEVYGTARRGVLTRVAAPFAARARMRRHRLFVQTVGLRDGDRVVDVGCGSAGLRALDSTHDVTGLDVRPQPRYAGGPERFVQGDAVAMPFADGAFDVAYCNSLIEHLEPADRPKLAAELRRVAGRYFVQTPNRWFPIEPHVLLPLFQFLPRAARRRLWRFGASGEDFHDIHLLGRRELARLFPEARILRERVGPLTKSYMVVGPW